MIAGNAGLMLYLWAFFSLTVIVMVGGISLFSDVILLQTERYSAAARRRFLWCVASAPQLVGVAAIVITLLPSMSHEMGWTLDHCHYHGNEHGHLCWYHPATFHVFSGLGLIAFIAFVFLSRNVFSEMRQAWRAVQGIRTLLAFATPGRDGFLRLDSEAAGAFTAGFFKPRKLITVALEQALSTAEWNVVQWHESAHAARRDPLQIFLFKFLMSVFPHGVRRRFIRVFEEVVEQDADHFVAGRLQDRVLVASTLLKVNRLVARARGQGVAYASCHFGADALEQRVRLLLDENPRLPFPAGLLLALVVTLAALGVYHAEMLHHYIEYLLSH